MGIYEETYGVETTFFTGMNLGDGLLRHPVTLYETAFLLMLWIGLIQLEKKLPLVDGGRFKIFMISYLLFRFLNDFIKPHYTFSFGLSTIQLVCLGGLIYYAVYIFKPRKLFITQYA
jgi:prolipoprotein diacylglyceryltransferase